MIYNSFRNSLNFMIVISLYVCCINKCTDIHYQYQLSFVFLVCLIYSACFSLYMMRSVIVIIIKRIYDDYLQSWHENVNLQCSLTLFGELVQQRRHNSSRRRVTFKLRISRAAYASGSRPACHCCIFRTILRSTSLCGGPRTLGAAA